MNDAKRRILFLVTTGDWGGVQFFISRLSLAAASKDFEILVAAGSDGIESTGTNPSLKEHCQEEGLPFRELRHMHRDISPWHDLAALGELRQLFRDYRPDIIHLNSSKMGVLGSIAGRLEHIPRIIYRIGGWSFLEEQPEWKRQLYLLAEKWTSFLKDIIVTVHPADEAIAHQKRILPRKQLLTIANGIDLQEFDNKLLSREKARERLGLSAEDMVVGTVANFYSPKNLPEYLQTIAEFFRSYTQNKYVEPPPRPTSAPRPTLTSSLPRFVIIGDGPERKTIEKKLHDLHLEERVVLAGRRSDASELLRAFDIFILPSSKEGMPWALLEAMAAGLPCIATDVGACRWMLEPDAGLTVPSHDRKALVTAIQKIADDPALQLRLGQQARATVEMRFRWETTLEKNLELFILPLDQVRRPSP